MSKRWLATVGSIGSMVFSTPALAQVRYEVYYDPKPIPPILLVLVLAVGGLLLIAYGLDAGWFSSSRSSRGPCNCPECTGVRYEQEAQLIREITWHQDAHTDMMRSEIKHAQTHGEYREREDIAAHEQRLRELRSRLN